jgi:hypothetical protein
MNLKDLKVVFAGCARDCANYLPTTLQNIRHYSSLFSNSYTVIVENGSLDKTKEILSNSRTKKDRFLFCDQFNQLPTRGQRLENSRNHIIETIKQNKNLKSCDLFIMLDLDDMGTFKIDDQDLSNAVKFLFSKDDIAAVFANQLGTYYDMWTLRDRKYCKDDFWVEIFKFLMKNKNSHDQLSKKDFENVQKCLIDKKIYSFDRLDPPIPVFSAFGGFGIYKMKNVLKNNHKYQGLQTIEINTKDKKKFNIQYQKCEHVNFNEGLIKQNFQLFILPFLINFKFQNLNFKPETALKLIVK